MKNKSLYGVIFMCFVLVGCKNEAKEAMPEVLTTPVASQKIDEGILVDVSFTKEEATALFDDYIVLKNALVQTDVSATSKAALALAKHLSSFENNETALAAVKAIVNTKTIEAQRTEFVVLSSEVEKLLQGLVASGAFYKQYCPMAFGNKGAYWLSNSRDIRNPYFGDKMLTLYNNPDLLLECSDKALSIMHEEWNYNLYQFLNSNFNFQNHKSRIPKY